VDPDGADQGKLAVAKANLCGDHRMHHQRDQRQPEKHEKTEKDHPGYGLGDPGGKHDSLRLQDVSDNAGNDHQHQGASSDAPADLDQEVHGNPAGPKSTARRTPETRELSGLPQEAKRHAALEIRPTRGAKRGRRFALPP
jgi:hypothetical protein